jgi:hypothetical protein
MRRETHLSTFGWQRTLAGDVRRKLAVCRKCSPIFFGSSVGKRVPASSVAWTAPKVDRRGQWP